MSKPLPVSLMSAHERGCHDVPEVMKTFRELTKIRFS